MIKIGFTGTRLGMTSEQMVSLLTLLLNCVEFNDEPIELHHGGCVGADEQCHALAIAAGIKNFHVYPANNANPRYVANLVRNGELTIQIANPAPALERNHKIVAAVSHMYATPKQDIEEMRSGTWATLRYAWKNHKGCTVIFPDGTKESQ